MKCSLLTLSCALDGELSRERQLELDAHLITCERCKTGMRYLREETERISVLAPVRLTSDKAVALLERSRVSVTVAEPSAFSSPEPHQNGVRELLPKAPDPFGAMGIGSAVLGELVNSGPATSDPVPEVTDDEVAGPSADGPEELGSGLSQGSSFGAQVADVFPSDALAAVPEELWLAEPPQKSPAESVSEVDDDEEEEAKPSDASEESADSRPPTPTGVPFPVAAEEGEAEPFFGREEASDDDTPTAPTVIASEPEAEPTGSDRPSSIVVPGWEPATDLKMPWGKLPPTTPTKDTWASNLADLSAPPVERESAPPPPADIMPPPTRPAAAAVPGLQADSPTVGLDRERPVRSAERGVRRPAPPGPTSDDRPGDRSWTRIGLIAVAALAVVLIGWNLTHSSKPAVVHHPGSKATAPASPKPSPGGSAKPVPTPAALALTGTQTLGSTGSGYRVEGVQYGVHGSQIWVVFRFSGGTGVPKITSGYDGTQTIYLEMQGISPGTPVAQPAAGGLVTSVSVGHVAGFTGAVYVIQLSRAGTISPSELTGTEAGAPGYLAIIQ